MMTSFSADASSQPPKTAPFGSWRSPITTQMLVKANVHIGDLSVDGEDLYWVESRPEEDGRCVVVRQSGNGKVEDVLSKPYSARTLVHEYGGGALLASEGVVYFSNFADQRIWRVEPGKEPRVLTPDARYRFADLVHDRDRQRLICVCEDHRSTEKEPANRIVAVDTNDGQVTTLVEGADFYSSPQVSPDSCQLAWLSWNHPNMPWDGTELRVAAFLADGTLDVARTVSGGEDESVFQPAWSPDGALYFVSDRSNWWNLYRELDENVTPVCPLESEFGAPQWVFGMTTYGFESDGGLVARHTDGGFWRVTRIDPDTGDHTDLSLPYTTVSSILVGKDRAYAVTGSATEAMTLVEINLSTSDCRTIRKSTASQPDPGYTSVPEAVEFPTANGQTAHAFYYPPANRNFQGPEGEAPPLLVIIHGGPTSATTAQFRLNTQYWTSRGFAVCDVNYGGSTGYGREYRNRLRDSWGLVDVSDATNAARHLAKLGKADQDRLIIRGGSAGGYTTLACLAFRDEFCCGASYYGVSDLALLARDTHKFESRYLDRLVGPYPEDEQTYRDRSPIHHLEGFDQPIILLQGLEDEVVPPNQAESILEALKLKGVPVAYVPFEGEQHGFRKAENIIRAHEAELYFYSRMLGFELPDKIQPVEIFNLE
jgi:dipeptidyl aminopeptidase/acylaminoacyl peptidase